jgi:circadian clock protein KaiC
MGMPQLQAIDVSYLTDAALLFRYFEYRGEIRQAISVLKRRTGRHERTIRELKITDNGIQIGPPITNLRGIMSGIATYDPIDIEND